MHPYQCPAKVFTQGLLGDVIFGGSKSTPVNRIRSAFPHTSRLSMICSFLSEMASFQTAGCRCCPVLFPEMLNWCRLSFVEEFVADSDHDRPHGTKLNGDNTQLKVKFYIWASQLPKMKKIVLSSWPVYFLSRVPVIRRSWKTSSTRSSSAHPQRESGQRT